MATASDTPTWTTETLCNTCDRVIRFGVEDITEEELRYIAPGLDRRGAGSVQFSLSCPACGGYVAVMPNEMTPYVRHWLYLRARKTAAGV